MSRDLLSLKDIQQLWLSRDAITKWMTTPSFLQAMSGLYCRVVMRDANAQKRYRIARVERIVFPDAREDKPSIELTQGNTTRTYPLHFVSNTTFAEDELEAFYDAFEKAGMVYFFSLLSLVLVGDQSFPF